MRLDQLYNVRLKDVRRSIMAWLNHAQQRDPATLVATAAVVFLAICTRFSVSPRRVLEVAERVFRDAPDKDPAEARALRMYLENEL